MPLVIPPTVGPGIRGISHSGDGSESGVVGVPLAHHTNIPPHPKTPKVKSLSSMPSTPQTPTVLDLTKKKKNIVPYQDNLEEERCENEGESDSEGVPAFSRMVPGCGSSNGVSGPTSTPSVPPMMPSDRVVTGIDNPVAPPPQQASSSPQLTPANPASTIPTLPTPSEQRKSMHPPKRSATIGSEESSSNSMQKTSSQMNKSAIPNISTSPVASSMMQPPTNSLGHALKNKERIQSTASTSSVSPPQSPVFDDSSHQRNNKRRQDYKPDPASHGRSRHPQGYRDEMARWVLSQIAT